MPDSLAAANAPAGSPPPATDWPTVTIVFLVYNRREQLREALQQMLTVSDYPRERVEAIVVDNASTDDTAEMVAAEFPQVQLIRRPANVGASGWNDGLAIARGDYVLILDDDCYLEADGLRRAVAAAEEHRADMVSFRVVSTEDPAWVFTEKYRTGLFSFWGCAMLMRRYVVTALGGYDPEIFIWANELEFTLRFFDAGFRHLHLPQVTALHMKVLPEPYSFLIEERGYRINARHWGYIAGKLLAPRDAFEALVALATQAARDGIRVDWPAFKAIPDIVAGFIHGLRRRAPLRNPQISSFYRHNFSTFASPWWLSRPAGDLLRSPMALLREPVRRGFDYGPPGAMRDDYFSSRALLYGDGAATLEFTPDPQVAAVAASASS
jgi:GT2 family glycosyltransferase